ncbi:sterol-binding protein [Jimgerdemannia flammicorona]|uniref:Sterol-binding protein n=1 Tax=Jimgerdemannia flammicorona TaxID=994334 RepID=A0A433D775_9FUNG|nr:sterol-binding protein [Jimgerdemannia flammicorona]
MYLEIQFVDFMEEGFDAILGLGVMEEHEFALVKKVSSHQLFALRLTHILFQIKNAEGKEQIWTADIKKAGTVIVGKGEAKPDIVIILSDKDFGYEYDHASGKLKVKGQMMLATKLDAVLQATKPPKAKL